MVLSTGVRGEQGLQKIHSQDPVSTKYKVKMSSSHSEVREKVLEAVRRWGEYFG